MIKKPGEHMTIEGKKKKYAAVAVITACALLLGVHPFYEIRYSDARTNCFPYKIWFIDKTASDPQAGDFIAFNTPEAAAYVPRNKTWIKMVLAAEGGLVSVLPSAGGETVPVEVNGIERKLPVRARVLVDYKGATKTFIAFAADSLGRPLPVIKSTVIPSGSYFAYSPVIRSYDSRYWGLVRKHEILGKAYPIY
jgi:type IV secretory pathway protease TraF